MRKGLKNKQGSKTLFFSTLNDKINNEMEGVYV